MVDKFGSIFTVACCLIITSCQTPFQELQYPGSEPSETAVVQLKTRIYNQWLHFKTPDQFSRVVYYYSTYPEQHPAWIMNGEVLHHRKWECTLKKKCNLLDIRIIPLDSGSQILMRLRYCESCRL